MNLEQMRYIVEAAKTSSFTQVSKNLNVTLPAISQSISLLESELGLSLFTRSRGIGATPTPEGMAIITKANEILIKVDEMLEEAQSYTNALSGHLRIATIPGPMHLLVDTVSSFKKDFPKVKIEIIEKGTKEILEDIHTNHVDIGFIVLSEEIAQKEKECYFDRVLEGKLVVGVNKNSPLSLNKTIRPHQLSGHTLVLYDDEFIRTDAYELIAQYGDVNVLFITNNTRAIQNAVKQGIAVTIGLDYSFADTQAELTHDLITIDLELPFSTPVYYGLVCRKDKTSSNILNRFISRINGGL